MNTFTFIGELVIPKENKLRRSIKSDKAVGLSTINIGIKEGNNMAFVSVFDGGLPTSNIKVKDINKIPMEVTPEKRMDENTLKDVMNWYKYKTNLGCEEGKIKEFVSTHDFAEYILAYVKDLPKNSWVKATGTVKFTNSKGKTYKTFDLRSLFVLSPSQKENSRGLLSLNLDLYYNDKGIDNPDGRNIVIDSFVQEYVREKKEQRYIPLVTKMDLSKMDLKDEKQKRNYDSLLMFLVPRDSDYVKTSWVCKYINGAEVIDMPTEDIDPLVAFAMANGVENNATTKTFGNNIEEIKLIKPQRVTGSTHQKILDSHFLPAAESNAKFEDLIYDTSEIIKAMDTVKVEDNMEDIFAGLDDLGI